VPISTAYVSVPDERDALRRRPAWIPTLATIVFVIVCIIAGNWQHRRMQEKEALAAQVRAAEAAPAVSLPAHVDDWQQWRFRRVQLTGEFDARHAMLIDNRIYQGRAGFAVVVPLRIEDGRVVLVDRGWIALGASRAVLPQPAVPSGSVTIHGTVEVPPRIRFGRDEPKRAFHPLWQHVDPERFEEATGIRVLPIVVHAVDGSAADGLVRDAVVPDTGIEKHLSYMLQWYVFAAMAVVLWFWFALRPHLRKPRAENA